MGELPRLTATFPHPQGEIRVEYTREGEGLNARITLPGSLKGNFVFNGKTWPLKPGENMVSAR